MFFNVLYYSFGEGNAPRATTWTRKPIYYARARWILKGRLSVRCGELRDLGALRHQEHIVGFGKVTKVKRCRCVGKRNERLHLEYVHLRFLFVHEGLVSEG